MEDEGQSIKECFAYFGRAVYMFQTIEKGLLNCLIFSYQNITKSRYDELFFEKSQLTFGQLKREIIQRSIFESDTIIQIDSLHEKRDWLAHSYWWDRAVEFYSKDLRHKIIKELDDLAHEIENMNEIIQERNYRYTNKLNLTQDQLINEFIKNGEIPTTNNQRKLTKNETLVGIYIHEPKGGFQVPLFKFEDGSYWELCESGLTHFNIDEMPNISALAKTEGIFPVFQFNPRPKISSEWNYELDLKKKGLCIKVRSEEIDGKFIFKWSVKMRTT